MTGPDLPERYEDLGPIGLGGMGEVRRVFDRVLGRTCALKLVRPELQSKRRVLNRLRDEARATAQLEHPGIVPVHDLGELPDGRVWFTMREVRGQTLKEVLLDARRPESRWTLRRLMDLYAQICRAVAHAHRRGVLHRDLKPDNVMVGEFGEVQVMDWGIAKRLDVRGHDPDGDPDVSVDSGDDREVTSFGDAVGTPAYMAPEQARGWLDRLGPPTDVFALGGLLFEILSGRPPYEGTAEEATLVQAWLARPVSLPANALTNQPEELVLLCTRCLAADPQERPADAGVLLAEVEAWSDGARRREEALALVLDARAALPQMRARRAQAAEHRRHAAVELATLPMYAAPEAKREAWAAEDSAAAAALEADLLEVRYAEQLRAALVRWPDLAEAHQALADHYLDRFVDAESRRDGPSAARFEALLREHDDGSRASWLAREVEFELRTSPPGLRVTCAPYLEVGRRRVPGASRPLGETPLRASLPPGSWRLVLADGAGREWPVPLHLPRGASHMTLRPGDHEARDWIVPDLADDERWVAPGWFRAGGDDFAVDALPTGRVWVDGFVAKRFPVTFGEYLAFLQEAGDVDPTLIPGEPDGAGRPSVVLRDGAWSLAPGVEADWPVALVPHPAARAFAAWRARVDDLPWRLPTECEWEKAARGVDGRLWPWGDHHEPAWSRMVASARVPGPASVRACPEDESPYGVRGLAGGVRCWTSTIYASNPGLGDGSLAPPDPQDALGDCFVVRGGNWSSVAAMCRPATRFGNQPHDRFNCGFRLVRTV